MGNICDLNFRSAVSKTKNVSKATVSEGLAFYDINLKAKNTGKYVARLP